MIGVQNSPDVTVRLQFIVAPVDFTSTRDGLDEVIFAQAARLCLDNTLPYGTCRGGGGLDCRMSHPPRFEKTDPPFSELNRRFVLCPAFP